MICRTCSCIIDHCGVGHHPTCPRVVRGIEDPRERAIARRLKTKPAEAVWLCGRGHTTRQPKCPACHDIALARAQAATPAVVIDAAMFAEIVAALAALCYLTHREFCATCGEWDCEKHGYHDLLARVRAAREGK